MKFHFFFLLESQGQARVSEEEEAESVAAMVRVYQAPSGTFGHGSSQTARGDAGEGGYQNGNVSKLGRYALKIRPLTILKFSRL